MADEAWTAAKATRDYERWLSSLRREKTERTADDCARTVRDLLAAYPDKER